jgi:hypothetical protein
MLHSKIEEILQKNIVGEESLSGIEKKFHAVEYEIDNMAQKNNADMNKIIQRAKELIYRIFDGHHDWLDRRWLNIKNDIEKNLKDLK